MVRLSELIGFSEVWPEKKDIKKPTGWLSEVMNNAKNEGHNTALDQAAGVKVGVDVEAMVEVLDLFITDLHFKGENLSSRKIAEAIAASADKIIRLVKE